MSTATWIERSEFARSARVENRARVLAVTIRSGSGAECAYCHKPIGMDAVEYEVEAMVLAGRRVLHFHRVCQHLWEASGD